MRREAAETEKMVFEDMLSRLPPKTCALRSTWACCCYRSLTTPRSLARSRAHAPAQVREQAHHLDQVGQGHRELPGQVAGPERRHLPAEREGRLPAPREGLQGDCAARRGREGGWGVGQGWGGWGGGTTCANTLARRRRRRRRRGEGGAASAAAAASWAAGRASAAASAKWTAARSPTAASRQVASRNSARSEPGTRPLLSGRTETAPSTCTTTGAAGRTG